MRILKKITTLTSHKTKQKLEKFKNSNAYK